VLLRFIAQAHSAETFAVAVAVQSRSRFIAQAHSAETFAVAVQSRWRFIAQAHSTEAFAVAVAVAVEANHQQRPPARQDPR
jgi:hypothetical protein